MLVAGGAVGFVVRSTEEDGRLGVAGIDEDGAERGMSLSWSSPGFTGFCRDHHHHHHYY